MQQEHLAFQLYWFKDGMGPRLVHSIETSLVKQEDQSGIIASNLTSEEGLEDISEDISLC